MVEEHLIVGSTASRIKYLLKDFILYGLASALVPLVSLVAVPLLTHKLSPLEYGAFELILSYIGVAVIIGGFGQDSALARYYYDTKNVKRRQQVINQAFWTQCLVSIIILGIVLILGDYIFFDIKVLPNFKFIIFCTALSVPAIVGFNFVRNSLKWTFHRGQYILVTLCYSAMVLLGYYILLGILNSGVLGALLVQMLSALLITTYGLYFLARKGLGWLNNQFSWGMFKYALPYVLLGILSQGFRAIDKTILTNVDSLEAAAIYSVGFKIATVILIVESTFNMAWGPVSMAIYKEKNSINTYNMAFCILGWLLSLIFLLVSYSSNWIVSTIAPIEYSGAALVAIIICIGFMVQSLSGVTAIGIELAKTPKLLIVSWVFGILVALGLMLMLVEGFGIVGVAIGAAAGLVVEGIIRTLCAYIVYPFRFKLILGLFPLVLAILMLIFSQYFPSGNTQLLVKILSIIIFIIIGGIILSRNWVILQKEN